MKPSERLANWENLSPSEFVALKKEIAQMEKSIEKLYPLACYGISLYKNTRLTFKDDVVDVMRKTQEFMDAIK